MSRWGPVILLGTVLCSPWRFLGLQTSGRIRASWAFANQASAAERLPAPQAAEGGAQRLVHVLYDALWTHAKCWGFIKDSSSTYPLLGNTDLIGTVTSCNPPPISGSCPWFSSQTSSERTVAPIQLTPEDHRPCLAAACTKLLNSTSSSLPLRSGRREPTREICTSQPTRMEDLTGKTVD